LVVDYLFLRVLQDCRANFRVEICQEVVIVVGGPIDSGVHEGPESVTIFERRVSSGEALGRLEELFFCEIAHALPVDRQLTEPPHEITAVQGRGLPREAAGERVTLYFFALMVRRECPGRRGFHFCG